MDWIAVLVSCAGGALAGIAAVYPKSFLAKRATTRASYMDRDNLLRTEHALAYEQERGKRLANSDDIERILKELAAVTEKAETIKAEVTRSFWHRQTLWMQQRDCYFALLEKASLLQKDVVEVTKAAAVVNIRTPETPQYLAARKEMLELQLRATDAYFALYAEFDRARIFLGEHGCALMNGFVLSFETERIQGQDWDALLKHVVAFKRLFIAAARNDLEVSPILASSGSESNTSATNQ